MAGDTESTLRPGGAAAPYGVAVVVRDPEDRYLLLGPDDAGTQGQWRAPAGTRREDESALAGALRELVDQTGLAGMHLWPVDLSGDRAVFATDVPAGVAVTSGQRRHEWAELDQAQEQADADAAEALRRVASVPRRSIGFRQLTRADLPQMIQWQRAPHAELWFTSNLDLATAHEAYGPRIDGDSHVRVHVLLVDDHPLGFVQHYRVGDDETYAAATGMPDAVALDYLIGDRRLVGRGLGPAMIWAYLREVVLPAHPDVTRIVASPDVDNERSLRALDKAGFRRVRQIPTPEPELLCILERAPLLGAGERVLATR